MRFGPKFPPAPNASNLAHSQHKNPPSPCTYYHRSDFLQLSSTGALLPDTSDEPTDLYSYIKQLPSGDQWTSSQIEIPDNGLSLAQSLQDSTSTAVSNGSYKDDYGTSCSVFRGNSTHQIISINLIPGPQDNQSSYRSKWLISGHKMRQSVEC